MQPYPPPAPTDHRRWPGAGECRLCGSTPAVEVTFRGHQGMVLMMRFLSNTGPYCRDCGLSVFRSMTAKTLWQGWWGIGSFLITPVILLSNLVKRLKFRKLAPPRPPAPDVVAHLRAPLDPGRPVFLRPAIAMLLLPVAVVAAFVLIDSTPETDLTGSCFQVTGDSIRLVDCAAPHNATVIGEKRDESTCPAGTTGTVVDRLNDGWYLCIKETTTS